MSHYYAQRHALHGSSIILLLISLIFVLSTHAQDAGPAEGTIPETPLATSEPIPLATDPPLPSLLTEEPGIPAVPTEPSAAAPITTQEVSPVTPAPDLATAEPTTDLEPTALSTETASSAAPPASLPTAEAALPAAPLMLTFSTNFDSAYPPELSAKTGWVEVATLGGQALQSNINALPIVYMPAVFTDAAVEARFLLNTGEGQITHGAYRAGLKADGTVTLYRDEMALVFTTVTLTNAWTLLRLEVQGTQIQISVDGTLIHHYAETMSVPQGQVGIAASMDAVVRVDDFAVYGVGVAQTSAAQPNEPLAVPTLLTPADGAALVDVQPTFSWEAVSGVSAYNIYIDEDAAFSSPHMIGLAPTSYTPDPPLPEGAYYWRVGVVIGGQLFWSTTQSFTLTFVDATEPPLLPPYFLSPDNGETLNTGQPMFTWGGMLGALEYDIEIDDEPTFTAATLITIATNSYTPDPALPEGTYYWRVASVAGSLRSNWSVSHSFTVDLITPPAPLATPILQAPANGVTLTDEQPTFSWQVVSGATEYKIEIANNAAFTNPLARTVSTTTYMPDPYRSAGTYYWRVAAVEGAEQSAWSEVRTLTLAHTLAAPVLQAPADHEIVTSEQPVFSWHAVAVVQSYSLQIDDDPTFTTPLTISQPFTSYSYIPGLHAPLTPGIYYWRVASGAYADVSDWSEIRTFTLVALISPARNSLFIKPGAAAFGITFKWAYPGGSANFTVQVADDPAFASVDASCSATASSCIITTLDYGHYWWRLNIGSTISESVPFQISPPAPRAVTLVSPANNRALQPDERPDVDLTWSWGTAASPAGAPFTYDVEVSTSANFGTLIASATDLDTPSFTTPDLADGTYYWHARALNDFALPGPWSATFRFIVDSVSSVTPPTFTVPLANAVVSTARPTFTWTSVPGAVIYTLEVAANCGDGEPFYLSGALRASRITLPISATPLPQGLLYACVTAYDSSGNAEMSEPRPFTVFLGTAPADGAFIAHGKPAFTWAATPGTTSLTLQYDTDTDFSSGAVSIPVSGTGKTLAAALPAGTYYWRVLRSSETFTSNVYRTLYVGVIAPAPIITEPSPTTPINTTTGLVWQAATPPLGVTLTQYEVQISKSSTFATLYEHAIVQGPSLVYVFDAPASENRVPFYWRVRGLSNMLPVTQWGSSRVLVDTVAPAAPILTAPNAAVLVHTLRPTFTWNAVPTATQYRVEIVRASDGTQVEASQIITMPRFISTENLPQEALIVRLEAGDGLNWSPVKETTFIVRLGTTPAQNAIVTTNRPTFTWAAVSGAAGYTLEIDKVDGTAPFSSLLFTADTTAPTYTPTPTQAQLITAGVYIWRVQVQGSYQTALEGRTFIYGADLKPVGPFVSTASWPDVADTLFNEHEAVNMIFNWTPLTLAPVRYEVQISTAAAFPVASTISRTSLGASLTLAGSALSNDGLKYWRVRGVYSNDGTGFGPWSAVSSFMMDREKPPVPLINKPTDDALVTTARPTLSWFASPGAVRYILTLSGSEGPVTQINYRSVTGTSLTLSLSEASLPQNNQLGYAWYVLAEDAAGNQSAVSFTGVFRLAVMLTPARGQVLTDPTPAFTWTPVTGTGAATWMLEISTSPAFDEEDVVYTSAELPANASSHTLPNPKALTANGLYYWRVLRSSDDPAQVQGHPFYVVNTTASITPQLTAPANGQWISEANSSTMLSWATPTEAGIIAILIGYQIEIATTNTFTAASIVYTHQLNDSMVLPPTLPDGTYYWRVRLVLEPDSLLGPVSAVRSFKLDMTPPSTPVLTAPVANAVLMDNTPTFTWSAATGSPTQYVLEIDETADFSSVRYSVTLPLTPALSHTLPIAQALPNGDYFWRVRARDAAGNLSTGAIRPLTVAAP